MTDLVGEGLAPSGTLEWERHTATLHLNPFGKDTTDAEKLLVRELFQFNLQFVIQFTPVEPFNQGANYGIIGRHREEPEGARPARSL